MSYTVDLVCLDCEAAGVPDGSPWDYEPTRARLGMNDWYASISDVAALAEHAAAIVALFDGFPAGDFPARFELRTDAGGRVDPDWLRAHATHALCCRDSYGRSFTKRGEIRPDAFATGNYNDCTYIDGRKP